MTQEEFLSKPLTLSSADPTPKVPTSPKKGITQEEFLAMPGLGKALSLGKMGVGGVSASQYLQGLQADQDPLAVKAANQGHWAEAANSGLQLLANTLQSGINSVITLPGLNTLINKIGNSDQEFGNVLSDYVNKVNKDFNQEVVPVYNNPQTRNAGEWLFENLPSLGSTVGMLLPVLGEIKLLGLGAKAMQGWNLMNKLVKASRGIELGSEAGLQWSQSIDAVVAGLHSRHAESVMEGQDAGNQAYEEAIAKGFSEATAKKAQLAASQETYLKNWPLLALDIMQFGVAFRTFKGLSREANALEAAALKGNRLGKAAVLGGEVLPEGYEEFQQYITTQEAVRNAKIKYGIDKDDYSTFSERIKDYMAGPNSDQLWTATVFGLLGGGVFAGIANTAGAINEKKGSIMREQVKTALGQTFAVVANDPIEFAKKSHDEIHALIFNAVENRRADDVKNLFSLMKESKLEGHTEEEKKELKAKADFGLVELEKYTKLYDEIAHKNTPEVTHHILAVNGAFTNWAQVHQGRTTDFNNALKFTTDLNHLDASYSKVIEAEAQLKVLDEFQKEPNLKIDKTIYDVKRSLLQEQIKQHREAIVTNNPTDNIDEKINKVDRSRLTSFAAQKVLVELHLGQLGVEAHKATTQDGIEEIKKRNEEHREKQIDTELNSLVDAVTPEKSSTEIQKLRDSATKLGKAKEFETKYNQKLAVIKTNSPKFDPNNTLTSLNSRWKDNTLLKEHEINNISKIMLKSGGIPENSTIDENSIAALANSNPVFAKQLTDYFKASNAIKTTTDAITKVPTSSTTGDPNEAADKEKKQADQQMSVGNAPVWVSQGTQFEWDKAKYDWVEDINGNLVPRKSNLTDKIDWKYLNSGSIPIGADLSYEYDYNDEWNKKNNNAELSLFEIVHYDSKGDRHVIGAVTAYDPKRNYETKEDGNKLKALREQLWKEAQSKPKIGIQKLDTGTRLKKYQSTNMWNVVTLDAQGNKIYNSPLDVLKPDEQLILGVARLQNNIPYLDFNGDPIGNKAVTSFSGTKGSSGMVYMMILNPATKEYYPVKLFAKTLNSNKELHEFVANKMRELENDPTKNKEVKDDISDFIFMHDLNFVNGNYNLTVGDIKDPRIMTIKPEELEEKIGELILQVDVTKINKDINGVSYNKQLAKNGFISTDLNPNEHFHSTNIQIEPYIPGTTFVEGELKITGQTLPTPSTVVVGESKFEKIQGVGTTSIDLSIQQSQQEFLQIEINRIPSIEQLRVDTPVSVDILQVSALLAGIPNKDIPNNYTELYSKAVKGDLGDLAYGVLFHLNNTGGAKKLLQKFYTENKARYSTVQEGIFEPLTEQAIRQWFAKNLPQVPISFVENLIEIHRNGGGKAWGRFKDGAITIYNRAPKSTGKHEAFHAVFHLFLSGKEQEEILNELANELKKARNTAKDGSRVINVIDEDLEETLAERFEDYGDSDGKNEQGLGYNVKQFFSKLWNFLKSIFSNDSTNITVIDQVFERINTGYYKNKPLPGGYKGTNYSIVNSNPYIVNESVDTINYQFFKALDELRKEYGLGDQSDLQVLKKINPNAKDALASVYQRVYNGLFKKYTQGSTQLEDILANFFTIENGEVTGTGDYYGLAVQDLVKYGIVVKEVRVENKEAKKESSINIDLSEVILTKDPIGSVVDETKGTGLCDGTCGLMVNRLIKQGFPYGETKIDDKYANYHAVAITEINGERFLLNQPQLEFLDRGYQKAPVYERALKWRGMDTRFNRHLAELNQYVYGMDINLTNFLTGKVFKSEYGDIQPIFENVKTEVKGDYISGEANLISDKTVKVKWRIHKEDELAEDIDFKSTKEGEEIITWSNDKFVPRLIKATEQNLINEYKLTKEQASKSLKKILDAKLHPGEESKSKSTSIKVDNPNNSDDLSDTIPEDFVFNFNEDDFKEDIHQKGASFINPKDTLTYEIRKTLRQLEKYKYYPNAIDSETGKKGAFLQEGLENHLGFHTFVNYDEVQNYLQKNIANIFDVDDMMNKLDELKFFKPEIHGLLKKLNENDVLKTKFFTDFSKIYIPYIMIQQKSVDSGFPDEEGQSEKQTRITVFNANTRSINRLLIDDWNTNLITHRNEVTNQDGTIDKVKAALAFNDFNIVVEAYRKFKEVTPEVANRLSATVNKFGLNITPQVFTNEFNARVVWEDGKRVERTPYNNLLDLLTGKNSITTILSNIVEGTNPYQGDAIESSALRRVTGAVARTESNLHQDSIINSNGDTQYSYLSPTFLHKKVAELKTEKGRELYLGDGWFMGNKWLQDLANPENQELRDVFEVSVFNSLKLENQASTEFNDLTTKELAIADINLYDNPNGKNYAFYRTPIITGSSMAPIIRFLKYDKATVIDAFYQLALVENRRIQNLANLDIKVKNLSTRGNQYHFVDIFNEKPEAIETENTAKLAIEEWLQNELTEEKSRLETEGVITSVGNFGSNIDATRHNSTFKDYEDKLEEYFYNRSLASAMIIQLFHVDPSYYKNNNDFQHRGGQILKTVKMIDTKASYNGTIVGENYNAIYLVDEKLGDSDITDSQTYISVDRRRKIGIGYGEWNENSEKGYELVKKGKAYDDSFTFAFSPQKPFYFNHETLGADWILPVQIKNMEVTLINNFTKDKPKLEFLREYMESNGIDSVIFTSAVKAGEYGAVTFNELKSGTKPTTHTFQNKYYGRQTEMPNHHVNVDILNASQQKKLITGDIPEDAKFFGDKISKQEIYDAYQKLITTNIIDSYNQIEGEFKDINEIQRILLNEVQSRGLGNSFRKALEIKDGIQGDKVFNIPLFDPIFGYKMQAILNAIIRNNVTKQRINGGSLAYMSAFGIVKPSTKEELKVVRDKDGNILHYEVMLPAWMKEHLPRNPKGEVDFDAIKTEAPGLLEMFGYFIPTEGKNSMMAANLVGFIPDLQSGVAAFPKELVAISGKDFDKDDVYIMIPNHEVVDGVLQKVGYGIGKEGVGEKVVDINLVKNVLPDETLQKMVKVKSIDPKTGEESITEMSVKDAINDIKDQYRKVEDYIECLG